MRKIFLLPLFFIFSCLPEATKSCTKAVSSSVWTQLNQAKHIADIQAIDDYLDANSQIAVEDPSGIRYVISTPGTGDGPCLESYLSVKYTGKLLSDGSVFDSSATPVSFYLSQLIAGWQIGLLKAKRDTKMTLYIPSGLAYGANPPSGIPVNANLIFELELVDFN